MSSWPTRRISAARTATTHSGFSRRWSAAHDDVNPGPYLRDRRGNHPSSTAAAAELRYREAPDFDGDSGWRFFSGDESQAYVDDPANSAVHDVNTIANYDPEIVPFLGEPVGTILVRPAPGSPLTPEPGTPPVAEVERLT